MSLLITKSLSKSWLLTYNLWSALMFKCVLAQYIFWYDLYHIFLDELLILCFSSFFWTVQIRMVSPAVALAFLPLLLTLLIKYRFYFVLFYRAVLVRIWKDLASGLSREERAYQYVFTHAVPGDPDSILEAFDVWCSKIEFISNIGPKKGEKILFHKSIFPEYGSKYWR